MGYFPSLIFQTTLQKKTDSLRVRKGTVGGHGKFQPGARFSLCSKPPGAAF